MPLAKERRAPVKRTGKARRAILGNGPVNTAALAEYHLQVKDDAEAFAPRREIPRTPPRPVKHGQNHSSSSSHTPVAVRPSPKPTSVKTPQSSKKAISLQIPTTPLQSGEDLENIPPQGVTPYERKVQAPCFTPRRTLARSPPRTPQPAAAADINDIPPPPRWEIPRTPIVPLTTTTTTSSSSFSSSSPPPVPHLSAQEKQASHTQATPSLPPSPPLPTHRPVQHSPPQHLAVHSSHSSPQAEKTPHTNGDLSHVLREIESSPAATTTAGTVDEDRLHPHHSQPESSSCRQPTHPSSADGTHGSSDSPPGGREEVEDGSSREIHVSEAVATQEERELPLPVSKSPPIAALKGRQGLLPGDLVCNETDLSFLKRMENVKYYDQLQSQAANLDKALKAAAEQKELLQHEAVKVENDLKDMRLKYQTTLSSIHALNLSADSASISSPAHSTGCPTPTSNTVHMSNQTRPDAPSELCHTHITQLRRKKQLMAVRLEKTDHEIQRKREELSQERAELDKIRAQKVAKEEATEVLQKEVQTVQAEKREWEERCVKVAEEHHRMEQQLEALQSQLSQLKLTKEAESAECLEEDATAERAKAEERLKRLISRCELYVKRHQILKELRRQDVM